ncbi:HNH endonuclease signature motif containing protein [Arthrobacter sp. PAMC 25486]|uniref:HNH endonuclease n=1 Tax=Arthrobacter sp. PAMC 25486 TaxID=1494608 RepID=UPI000571F9A8
MASSRTGTTAWKKVRAQALRRDEHNGVTQCRYCWCQLDYKVGLRPNSAEPDHILAHSLGGQDVLENLITICRRCNQSKGDNQAPKTAYKPVKTSRRW